MGAAFNFSIFSDVFMKAWSLLLLIMFAGCVEPFTARVPDGQTNVLVVEGYINVGVDVVTEIRLSRTVPLSQSQYPAPKEVGATIFIEDNLNNNFPLAETADGIYRSEMLVLPLDREYRIKISTQTEEEYTSDFLATLIAPPIDTITWQRELTGMDFYVSTHDPSNTTFYYQWSYEETWEENAAHFSFYGYRDGQIFVRENEEVLSMHQCFKEHASTIPVNLSTKGLPENKMSLKLFSVINNSPKLHERYTALVTLHALSDAEYQYLQILKKNSTDLGTFFDPQPSQVFGNIFGVTSHQPVVGYIGVYTTSEKRINLRRRDVLPWPLELPCPQVNIVMNNADSVKKYFEELKYTPTLADYFSNFATTFATPAPCADCRMSGNNIQKPDYWDELFCTACDD